VIASNVDDEIEAARPRAGHRGAGHASDSRRPLHRDARSGARQRPVQIRGGRGARGSWCSTTDGSTRKARSRNCWRRKILPEGIPVHDPTALVGRCGPAVRPRVSDVARTRLRLHSPARTVAGLRTFRRSVIRGLRGQRLERLLPSNPAWEKMRYRLETTRAEPLSARIRRGGVSPSSRRPVALRFLPRSSPPELHHESAFARPKPGNLAGTGRSRSAITQKAQPTACHCESRPDQPAASRALDSSE
jgi:hypothetical protein